MTAEPKIRNTEFLQLFGQDAHDIFQEAHPGFDHMSILEEQQRFNRSQAFFYPIKTVVDAQTTIHETGRCDVHELVNGGEVVGSAGYAPELNKVFYWKAKER